MRRAGQAAAALARTLLAPAASSASAAAATPILVLAGPGNNGGDALEAAALLAEAGLPVTVLHSAPAGAQSPERTAAWQRAQRSAARLIALTSAEAQSLMQFEVQAARRTNAQSGRQDTAQPVMQDDGQAMTQPARPRDVQPAARSRCDSRQSRADGWGLVIDGLFGIGLTRPITGAARDLVQAVNRLGCPVLALDVPSGLDADTGAVVGPNGVALRASHTLTFIGDKPGLHTNEGRDHAGVVAVAPLLAEQDRHGDAALPSLPPARMQLNQEALFRPHLHARRHSGHKGTYGSVAVIGGAHGMRGAPILSARTALHAGAGRVYVLYPDDALPADSGQPELMCRLAEGYDLDQATLAIGPGLGDSAMATGLLKRAIASSSALLIDADALNLLARDTSLQTAVARRSDSAGRVGQTGHTDAASRAGATAQAGHTPQPAQPAHPAHPARPVQPAHPAPARPGRHDRPAHATVLTPHPLEAARLLGVEVAAVQADRVAAARTLAARLQAVVVLKGSGTVIAAPDGDCVINPTGNPALATAGTGDVLSGLCSALLAQGCPPWPAALAAVWLHGAAADHLVETGIGPVGMTAGELIPAIRRLLNDQVNGMVNRQVS